MTPEQLRLVAYRPDLAAAWDGFVRRSKNGTFLLRRGYVDYHADRFEDASLLAVEGEEDGAIAALLPASRHRTPGGDVMISHGGLTYGGWISDGRMTTAAMQRLFALLRAWGVEQGVTRLRYKAIPHVFHRLPAEEDLYALFAAGGRLVRQDVSSVIELASAPAWAKGRKHALSKARRLGVSAAPSTDLADFHACLSEALARHGATPTHSAAELELLTSRFPDEIRLYAARREDRAIAYVLVFDCGRTIHTQYMCARAEGRDSGGLEAIIDRLQHQDYADRACLSFGISTEDEGRRLNGGLIAQKEMFGGRPIVHSFYELEMAAAAAQDG